MHKSQDDESVSDNSVPPDDRAVTVQHLDPVIGHGLQTDIPRPQAENIYAVTIMTPFAQPKRSCSAERHLNTKKTEIYSQQFSCSRLSLRDKGPVLKPRHRKPNIQYQQIPNQIVEKLYLRDGSPEGLPPLPQKNHIKKKLDAEKLLTTSVDQKFLNTTPQPYTYSNSADEDEEDQPGVNKFEESHLTKNHFKIPVLPKKEHSITKSKWSIPDHEKTPDKFRSLLMDDDRFHKFYRKKYVTALNSHRKSPTSSSEVRFSQVVPNRPNPIVEDSCESLISTGYKDNLGFNGSKTDSGGDYDSITETESNTCEDLTIPFKAHVNNELQLCEDESEKNGRVYNHVFGPSIDETVLLVFQTFSNIISDFTQNYALC